MLGARQTEKHLSPKSVFPSAASLVEEMEDILISVTSPPDIDLELFMQWVEGRTLEEAQLVKLDQMRKSYHQQHSTKMTILGLEFPRENYIDFTNIINYEVFDQYCAFQTLEHYLMQPYLIRSQSLCIVSPELQNWIIERYWSLDDLFVREILNKRLVKSRKDLEEISELSGLNLRRITRQLDNIKRTYSTFEDIPNLLGSVYNVISKNYLLAHAQCKRYACIIFLLYSKFNLTTKRRMMRIPCENLESCAALIMTFLCLDGASFSRALALETAANKTDMSLLDNSAMCWAFVWKLFPTVETVELDKELLGSLRNLRTIFTGEALDKGCNLIRLRLGAALMKKVEAQSSVSSMMGGSKLRNIVKSLLQLGANLSQSREYRDLLEDILTKVAEPLEESGLSSADMSIFLSACYDLVNDLYLPERSSAATPTSGRAHYHSASVSSMASGGGADVILATNSVSSTHLPIQMNPHMSGSMLQIAANTQSSVRMSSKADQLKKDWLRFITFAKLALLQLVGEQRRG